MDAQLKRGLIEACVLAAVSRHESYGYEIIKELPEVLGMTESTLYPVLRRLAGAGLVTQRSARYRGRLRRYYGLTQAGAHYIDEFLAGREQVNEVYDFIAASSEASVADSAEKSDDAASSVASHRQAVHAVAAQGR